MGKDFEMMVHKIDVIKKTLSSLKLSDDMTPKDVNIGMIRSFSKELTQSIREFRDAIKNVSNGNLKVELNAELLSLMSLQNHLVFEYVSLQDKIGESQTNYKKDVGKIKNIYWDMVATIYDCDVITSYHSLMQTHINPLQELTYVDSAFNAMECSTIRVLFHDDFVTQL
ncbi:MAG: hypothetical protein EOM41_08440 [Bacilli bacterium]|nr:hypothetical protein [Bacilli bacterium]